MNGITGNSRIVPMITSISKLLTIKLYKRPNPPISISRVTRFKSLPSRSIFGNPRN
ncbi:hypothetical protein I4U23_020196 [Adineta vaga]|nr:hypothetical protein I4U23_020196 [Adineta vaga]